MATAIGPFIRKYRKKEKISGKELSKEIGVSTAYISHIETGRIELPSLKIMISIARHLNIPMQKMMQVTGYSLEESVIEEETAKQKEIKAERVKRRAQEKRELMKKMEEDKKEAIIQKEERESERKERLIKERNLKKEERIREREEQVEYQASIKVGAEEKEQKDIPAETSQQKKSLISMHPLEVLLSLQTATLADMFLTHMRKGKTVYHTYLVHALVKGADGNGSSREIVDLMIANHHELLHIEVFQLAIVRYAEQNGLSPEDPSIGTIKTLEDVEEQSFFPLWKKAYFSENVLRDYGDYELSSHKVDTFEMQPLLQSHMVLLNGRIVNPNTVRTIKALLLESTNL